MVDIYELLIVIVAPISFTIVKGYLSYSIQLLRRDIILRIHVPLLMARRMKLFSGKWDDWNTLRLLIFPLKYVLRAR